VLQRTEDESSSKEFENEEEEISDEPNHDPCEDFEFDETGARVNKFPYVDHARKFVKRGDVCENVDCVCLSPPATQDLLFLSSFLFFVFFYCFGYLYNGSCFTF
jgi:hypothetical protein